MTTLFQPWLYNPFSPFGAVVDTWALNPLLSEHPYKLLKHKRVHDLPWIASYTSAEGLYPASGRNRYSDDTFSYKKYYDRCRFPPYSPFGLLRS